MSARVISYRWTDASCDVVSLIAVRTANGIFRGCAASVAPPPVSPAAASSLRGTTMNVSGSSLSKVALRVNFPRFWHTPRVKIRHLFLVAGLAAVASSSFGYVREFDNGIPLAWVKDRTVIMQLSLGTGTRTLRDGFTSFNDSAIDALKTWNPHLAHLQFSWVKNSPVAAVQGDDEMSVIIDSKVFGSNFGSG